MNVQNIKAVQKSLSGFHSESSDTIPTPKFEVTIPSGDVYDRIPDEQAIRVFGALND